MFEFAQVEILRFDRALDGILPLPPRPRGKLNANAFDFPLGRGARGSPSPSIYPGLRLRSTLGYFKCHPAGV